jgi:hypothetical protein
MSETMRTWVEVIFNVTYLITVWALVVMMIQRLSQVSQENRPVAKLFIWAFGLLALGDTGHVGFRVLAYALGDLETTISLLGTQTSLVGLGALSTAVTVTGFYIVMLLIWKRRFKTNYGWFEILLFAAAGVRLVLMAMPQNAWNQLVPPWPWALYRNLPLMVQGLGVAYLILRDALAHQDRTFIGIGVMILISYTFYTPVILWVRHVPLLGMLMIPKTLAYVGISVIAYRDLFRGQSRQKEAHYETRHQERQAI